MTTDKVVSGKKKTYTEIVHEYGGILIILKGKNSEEIIYSKRVLEEFHSLGYSPERFREDIKSSDAGAYSRARYFLAKVEEKFRAENSDTKIGLIIEIEGKLELLKLDHMTAI